LEAQETETQVERNDGTGTQESAEGDGSTVSGKATRKVRERMRRIHEIMAKE